MSPSQNTTMGSTRETAIIIDDEPAVLSRVRPTTRPPPAPEASPAITRARSGAGPLLTPAEGRKGKGRGRLPHKPLAKKVWKAATYTHKPLEPGETHVVYGREYPRHDKQPPTRYAAVEAQREARNQQAEERRMEKLQQEARANVEANIRQTWAQMDRRR